MCGHLLNKHSTLAPLNQGSLHGYGWQRGVGTSSRGARQLQELYDSEPGSHPDNLNREPASSGNDCGPDSQERRRERRHGQEGQVAQGAREGLPKVQRPVEPESTAGAKILVGGQGPARLFQEQRGRTEVRCQGLGTASSPSRGLPIGDASGQPVCHLHEEQEFGSGVHAGLERRSSAPFGREPLERPQRAGAAKLEPAASNSALQLVADSHQVQNRRDQEQPRHSRASCQDEDLEDENFPYLQWSPEESKHIKVQQAPLSMTDALQVVDQLQPLIIHPNTIGRFHPLRRLTPDMASDVIPWTLEIQSRTQEAQVVYQLVGRLIRNGVTHLAASTLRPSKLGRSPLATAVDKMIQEL